MFAIIRRYFISGLLTWIPIIVTLLAINFLVELLTSFYHVASKYFHFGVNIPGFGFILSLCVIFLTGILTSNFIGKKLMSWWNLFVSKIPLVRTIYLGVKQVIDTMFTKGQAFRKVYLVEYPRKGLWTIALQTGKGHDSFNAHISQVGVLTLFVPTTPNPTSGFIIFAREDEVIPLEMTVDQALKYVISLGVVQP
jgi:uncharacterized membrane protein